MQILMHQLNMSYYMLCSIDDEIEQTVFFGEHFHTDQNCGTQHILSERNKRRDFTSALITRHLDSNGREQNK